MRAASHLIATVWRYCSGTTLRERRALPWAIWWRADEDKMGQEWTTPLPPKARRIIDRLRRERAGLGNALLPPSAVNPRSRSA